MARRKWTAETIGQWITEAAAARLRIAAQRPASEDIAQLERLPELDSVALQSLGGRLGRYMWERLPSPRDLEDLAAVVMRVEAPEEPQSVMQRAFLRATGALREAAALGEIPVTAPCEPDRITKVAGNVVRGRRDGQSFVTGGLVRSLIEPLLGGDRSAFRSQVGEIGGALVKLESAGLDGRIENLAEMPLYWELKSLQWLLNGVLQASRARRATDTLRETARSAEPEILSESLSEIGVDQVVERTFPGADNVSTDRPTTTVEIIDDGVDGGRQQAQRGLERLLRD